MESELSTPKTRRESEVWQACDDLWAQNASPRSLTGDNIRDQLVKLGYKRGSPNEIYRYRSSWRESRGIKDQSESNEVEAKASDPISRAVSMVYDQMRTQASDEIAQLTEEFETERKTWILEEQTLKETLVTLESERADLRRDLSSAQKRISELDIALTNEQREMTALAEKLRSAREQIEMQRSEQERLVLELKTFHEREIDLWRSQVAQAQKLLAEVKQQSKTERDKQGAEFSEALMKLKTELRQSQEEKSLALGKLDTLAEVNALFAQQERRYLELLASQRKLELYAQRKSARVVNDRSKGRRC